MSSLEAGLIEQPLVGDWSIEGCWLVLCGVGCRCWKSSQLACMRFFEGIQQG